MTAPAARSAVVNPGSRRGSRLLEDVEARFARAGLRLIGARSPRTAVEPSIDLAALRVVVPEAFPSETTG